MLVELNVDNKNLTINNQYSSLPKLYFKYNQNFNKSNESNTDLSSTTSSYINNRIMNPSRNKLESSITFPNFNSKTLLGKFNFNLKIEEAFKYTKLLNDRTQQSSLDTIKLKFPNLNKNFNKNDSKNNVTNLDSAHEHFGSNSNEYFDL
jgi:hypothetical protein